MKNQAIALENEFNENETRIFNIKAETEKAFMINQNNKPLWIAKSVLKPNPMKRLHTGTVKTIHKIIPYWYMKKNNISLNPKTEKPLEN